MPGLARPRAILQSVAVQASAAASLSSPDRRLHSTSRSHSADPADMVCLRKHWDSCGNLPSFKARFRHGFVYPKAPAMLQSQCQML